MILTSQQQKKDRDEYVKEKKYRIAGGPSSHMFLGIMMANVRKKAGKQASRQADRGAEKKRSKREKKERKRMEVAEDS